VTSASFDRSIHQLARAFSAVSAVAEAGMFGEEDSIDNAICSGCWHLHAVEDCPEIGGGG